MAWHSSAPASERADQAWPHRSGGFWLDALETLRLTVACTRSWREGRPVRVDEITG
jgi:hypothetical protein